MSFVLIQCMSFPGIALFPEGLYCIILLYSGLLSFICVTVIMTDRYCISGIITTFNFNTIIVISLIVTSSVI